MIPASKSPLKDQPSSDDTISGTHISDVSIKFQKPSLASGILQDIEIKRLSQHTPEAGTPNPTTPQQRSENCGS